MTVTLHENRLAHRFRLLDTDGDGVLRQDDLQRLADQLCDKLGAGDNSPNRTDIQEGYAELWRQLVAHADTDADGQISEGEYVSAIEHGVLRNPAAFAASIERFSQAMFRTMDTNNSGTLSVDEMARMGDILNLPDRRTAENFNKLDRDGDGSITAAEFLGAIREYYYSNEPDAAAAHLFGSLS